MQDFPRLFCGLLELLKNFQAKFEVKTDIEPNQQKLRPITYHLRDAVADEIKGMLDDDIIEPASGVKWVSPLRNNKAKFEYV
jgi:hypothetical protein